MNVPVAELFVIAATLAVSFFASAWVNAITRLTKRRAEALMQQNQPAGRLLMKIADDPPRFLTSALLIMLLCRVTSVVVTVSLLIHADVTGAEVLAVVVMTFVLFELVELAPRTWVLESLDRVLLLSARPVYFLGRLLRPVVSLMVKVNWVFLLLLPGRGMRGGPITSEEEIRSMLEVAESEEVIEAEEAGMIQSIFEFTDTIAREVMVPRPDMVCAEASWTAGKVLDLTLQKGFSRVPVINNSIDEVAGIAYQKDLINHLRRSKNAKDLKISELAREAVFVPESKKISELLREMQQTKTHMVIVVDEYGGTAGLATLEDLLEEIVGEISDEYDKDSPNVEKINSSTLRVSASLGIDELNDLLGSSLPHDRWDSVGGLVGAILGRVAVEGDEMSHDGIEFKVEKMNGRRISKVLVRNNTQPVQQAS